LAGFFERIGEDGEDDAAIVVADEVEAALLMDEFGLDWHGSANGCAIGSIHRSREEIKIEVEAGDGNLGVYQIGTDAEERQGYRGYGGISGDDFAREAEGGECARAAPKKWIENEIVLIGGSEEDAFEEGQGLLGGMLAEFFLPGFGRRD